MKGRLILAALFLARAAVPVWARPIQDPQDVHRLHQDAKAYVAFLEDPGRDAYQKPMEVISALNLKEGDVIADIGAGDGVCRFLADQGIYLSALPVFSGLRSKELSRGSTARTRGRCSDGA